MLEFKNFEELKESDPDCIVSASNHYLERPAEGWIELEDVDGFVGIGYNGLEDGYFTSEWRESGPHKFKFKIL